MLQPPAETPIWPAWTIIAALAVIATPAAVQLTAAALPDPPEPHRFIWDADEILAETATADPYSTDHKAHGDGLHTATLTAEIGTRPLIVRAAWEPALTPTQIRIETYTDNHGTGLRLAVTGAPVDPVGDRDTGVTAELCTRSDQPRQRGFQIRTGTYTPTAPTALSGWAQYNDASLGAPQPLKVALTADLRTCDTENTACTTDTGSAWLTDLLDHA